MPATLRLSAALLAAACASAADNDARDQLARRLTSLAMPHLTERARTILGIQSRAAAEKRQQQVRAKLLSMIGGLPTTNAPLNPRSNGTLQRDGFRIEKIVFESLPNFFVTANVYLPSGVGPFPAVVMTPGHSAAGKAGELPLAANFALNGIAAIAYDPMSEGERLQYFDAATGKSAVGGPTGEHSQASIAANLVGEHISRYFIWDAMRAIDYLSTRTDIDAHRIGALGCSGGGAVTAYLAAFDPRVTAAASACYITAFQDLLAAPTGAQEAEQTIPGFISAGFDLADWVELAAPRPYAIVSTTEDMFPYAGAQRTYEEARRFYALFGAEDQLQWITGPGPHGALTPLHPRILAFFKQALTGSTAAPAYRQIAAEKPTDLEFTSTGQVANSLHGETIAGIIAGVMAKVHPARADADFRTPAGIQAKPGKPAPVNTGFVGETLNSEDGVLLPGRHIATQATGRRPLVLILGDDLPDGLAQSDRVVWQASLRPAPPGIESAKSPLQGAFYLLGLRAELIGRTLLGMRVDDIIHWVDALAAKPEVDPRFITIYARGAYGVALLHAAALDKRITHAVVEDVPRSYREIVEQPLHRNAPEISVPGVLQHYDLPDLVRAIGPKRLTLLELNHPEPLLPHLTR
ncbi:MAG: acetylxylan esterase [Candidatus Solibacter sp.]